MQRNNGAENMEPTFNKNLSFGTILSFLKIRRIEKETGTGPKKATI